MSKQSTDLVTKLLEEATMTLSMLPSGTVQEYFRPWPGIIHATSPLQCHGSKLMQLLATHGKISKLEEVLKWMHLLDEAERKLIWRCAANVPEKIICKELGCSRTTVWRKWTKAIDKISKHLNGSGAL